MIEDPKTFWNTIAQRDDWRDYILPRKQEGYFEFEGWIEAQRLSYFYDDSSVVVEYGCGVGRILQYVAQRAKLVIGLDISDGMLEKARNNVSGENIQFIQSEKFTQEDVANLVYSFMVLQHNNIQNQNKIMRHIHSILKPNGTAIVQLPRHGSSFYKEGEACHKFTKREVVGFGKLFHSYRIIEGNAPNYQSARDDMNHEYYLVAVK